MKTQKAICTIRRGSDGFHDLAEVNNLLANGEGWLVTQMISDCQSAFVYVLEKGQDDPPQNTP